MPTPITASMLYDRVACPHRVSMDLFGDRVKRDPTRGDRSALAGISPRCRNTPRTHTLMVGLSEDEVAQITTEARELARELMRKD